MFGHLLSLFFIWFHRDPNRDVVQDGFVSPVDGRIKHIEETDEQIEISVYLGITDVHIVRSPIEGIIEGIDRSKGGNYPAFLQQSEKNNSLTYRYEDGCIVSIMTGFIARRLKTKVDEGYVYRGQKIGLISFGSRSVVRLDKERYELEVSEGDRLVSGKTKIAK